MTQTRKECCRVRAAAVCAAIASLSAQSLYAANMWFARDMPISKMNAEDVAIMQSAVFAALDSAADGDTGHWQNSKTGAHGEFSPRSSYMDSGLRCRDLEIENSAGGLNHRSILTLCKTTEGWKIKSY